MIGILIRGMAVGITETVPGVSGSTVAMIVGIYERLVYSLSVLTTKKRKEVLPFLFIFGTGMVVGFASSIFFIDYLIKNYRTPTLMLFLGIIVGFLPYLVKETINQSTTRFKIKHYLIFFLFLCLVIVGQILSGHNNIDLNNLSSIDYVFLAIVGFIASTALVLPGISGALILTIFGVYEMALDSLIYMNIPIILAIGSGIVLGILFTSKLVQYLLTNHKIETYVAMIGLVSGSIYAILSNLNTTFDTATVIMSFITFFAGITFIIILERIQRFKFN